MQNERDSNELEQAGGMRVAVVADTHVPDRVDALHPELIPALRSLQISAIWHTGDICTSGTLEALAEIAPVTAVRGNRDWLLRGELPWSRRVNAAGVEVALLHGHGRWVDYLLDKWWTLVEGYQLERYQRVMRIAIDEAEVVVFGHTHRAVNRWQEGRLWFNPGSATMALRGGLPSFGVLEFTPGGAVEGKIVPLKGWRLVNRRWVDLDENS